MRKKTWVVLCIIIAAIVVSLVFVLDHSPSLEEAAFQITNLVVSPEETMVGEPVEISVTVTNTGDSEGSYTVSLTVDGVPEATQDITVAGKSEKDLSFTITKDAAHIYNASVDGLTAPFVVMTDYLLLTMSFDNDPDGYPQGSKAHVYILDGNRFRLEDIYGTFMGDYRWELDKNKLTLDFDAYPAWYMTLEPDGTFSGSEHDYANGGTYEWLGHAPSLEEAAFEITNLVVSPEETMVGEPVEISVTVTNTGDLEGNYTVSLTVDGVPEATQDITVAGKSEKDLSFTITKDAAHIYNATVDGLTAPFVVMTDYLLLTMSFDNDPDGYPQGSKAHVYILDGNRFRLEDRYGTFMGDYRWELDKNKLTLDFDAYPAWYMTLEPDGTFSGSEHGYANGGTYEWL